MSNLISFEKAAWEDYIYWQQMGRDKLKKINELIKESTRHPFEGKGKPEPLRGNLAGFWSRRIDEEHRMIYRYENNTLTLLSCRYHYQ
jgi:toxin YoeB